jgi:hypothetical protein
MLDANTRTEDSVEVILFLTDGDGTYTPSGYPGSPADLAASKDYTIYTVGLGSGPIASKLIDIATTTGGQYYNAPTAENLEAIFYDILTEIVINTAPTYVDVVEVTQDYIIDEGDFSIVPDSIVEVDGKTIITWSNVGQYVGDYDHRLAADETFTVSFTAGSSMGGVNLPVQVEGEAIVYYLDPDGDPQTMDIPQTYINVIFCVEIDIKPGSFPNAINPNNHGVVPVAILSNEDFDATTVDPTTVRFGLDETEPVHKGSCGHIYDVDHDGDLDVVFHFKTSETGIVKGDTSAYLTAYTYTGVPISGSDSVKTVGGKK